MQRAIAPHAADSGSKPVASIFSKIHFCIILIRFFPYQFLFVGYFTNSYYIYIRIASAQILIFFDGFSFFFSQNSQNQVARFQQNFHKLPKSRSLDL